MDLIFMQSFYANFQGTVKGKKTDVLDVQTNSEMRITISLLFNQVVLN